MPESRPSATSPSWSRCQPELYSEPKDTVCRRNAFGRQLFSFEEELEIPGISGDPVRAVFIRAPWIEDAGDAVEVLASVDGHPVAARQDNMLVISFHPELAGEPRVHELFLQNVR